MWIWLCEVLYLFMHSEVDADTLYYLLINYAFWFNLEQKKRGTETSEKKIKMMKNSETKQMHTFNWVFFSNIVRCCCCFMFYIFFSLFHHLFLLSMRLMKNKLEKKWFSMALDNTKANCKRSMSMREKCWISLGSAGRSANGEILYVRSLSMCVCVYNGPLYNDLFFHPILVRVN